MKLGEKLKNFIIEVVREESAELKNREILLEEDVRKLNAAIEGQEALAENVRNLNAQLAGYESLVENVRNLNAQLAGYELLVKNVRNLNAQLAGYEALVKNVRNLNMTLEEYEALAENVRSLNAAYEGYELLAKNVRNLNATLDGYGVLVENVRNLNAMIEGQETLEENVRNLNSMLQNYESIAEDVKKHSAMIQVIESAVEMQKVKFAMLEKVKNIGNAQRSEQISEESNITQTKQEVFTLTGNVYTGIDYFDFENHFRGSIHNIRESQKPYVKYFEGRTNVIDLGCGRGEFLELLKENDIDAQGVDLYEEFVEMCRLKNLKTTQADAMDFLKKQNRVGGIFAAQLIEHLSTGQLVMLCELAYEKLEDGAYIILETQNPQSLSIFANAFYVDPSHNKPVHPLTIEYILRKAGFKEIDIIYTESSRPQTIIPPIQQENMDEFNRAMKTVENMLFGSQDYAIIARR